MFKHFYIAVVDDVSHLIATFNPKCYHKQQIVNVIHLWYNDCIVFQIGIWMSVLQAEVMAQCMASLSLNQYTLVRRTVNNVNFILRHG